MDKKKYRELFSFPDDNSEMFCTLVNVFDENEFLQLSPHLNWFIAESSYHFGPKKSLEFLAKYSSKRISIKKIDEYFPENPRFLSIVERNLSENYLELQSMSGFMDCLRRYFVTSEVKNDPNIERIAHRYGASRRFVQRLKHLNY